MIRKAKPFMFYSPLNVELRLYHISFAQAKDETKEEVSGLGQVPIHKGLNGFGVFRPQAGTAVISISGNE